MGVRGSRQGLSSLPSVSLSSRGARRTVPPRAVRPNSFSLQGSVPTGLGPLQPFRPRPPCAPRESTERGRVPGGAWVCAWPVNRTSPPLSNRNQPSAEGVSPWPPRAPSGSQLASPSRGEVGGIRSLPSRPREVWSARRLQVFIPLSVFVKLATQTKQKKSTTLSGGSLGSCVDEERS